MKSARIGEDGLGTEPSVTSLKPMAGSAATVCNSDMIDAGLWPGKMRQLMLAVARCGKALSAWPPLTIVTTHVVPILPTMAGSAASVLIAASSAGLAAKARIAAARAVSVSSFAACSK